MKVATRYYLTNNKPVTKSRADLVDFPIKVLPDGSIEIVVRDLNIASELTKF